MSARPSDPFDLLQKVPLREPDPVRLETDTDLARAEFLDERALRQRGGLLARVFRGWRQGWRPAFAIPLGAGLAAVVVLGVWLSVPGRIAPDTDEPMLADDTGTPGTRLGARPMPEPLPSPDQASAAVSARYGFDGFEILLREPPGKLMLSLSRDGSERTFSAFIAEEGADFRVHDAFVEPRTDDTPLLLVRSEYGGFVNWNAYEMGADAITLSARLSLLIHDAPDRAAVTARLAASQTAP